MTGELATEIMLMNEMFDKWMRQRLLVSNEIFEVPYQLVEWLAPLDVSDLRGAVVNYLRGDQCTINCSARGAKSFGHMAAHIRR